jgi:hypothetical protein
MRRSSVIAMSESSSEEAIRAKGNHLSVIAMSESSSEEAIRAKGNHFGALPVHEFEAAVPPPDCFVSRRLPPRNDEPADSANSTLPMWTAPHFSTRRLEARIAARESRERKVGGISSLCDLCVLSRLNIFGG